MHVIYLQPKYIKGFSGVRLHEVNIKQSIFLYRSRRQVGGPLASVDILGTLEVLRAAGPRWWKDFRSF